MEIRECLMDEDIKDLRKRKKKKIIKKNYRFDSDTLYYLEKIKEETNASETEIIEMSIHNTYKEITGLPF